MTTMTLCLNLKQCRLGRLGFNYVVANLGKYGVINKGFISSINGACLE